MRNALTQCHQIFDELLADTGTDADVSAAPELNRKRETRS
jgi:hypothetical protein